MRMSASIWLAVAAGVAAVLAIVRLVRGKATARRLEVGAVSDQWVAEHRRDADPNSR
jgi:hypothetical protein